MYDSAINPYGLSDNGEYFLNIEDIPEDPEEIKAYVPKLMPNIPLGSSAINNEKVIVNTSIFVNAPDCPIHGVSSIIDKQNYLTIKPYPNQKPNFRKKAVNIAREDEPPIYVVKKHNKFLLELLHGDIGHMYYTEKI